MAWPQGVESPEGIDLERISRWRVCLLTLVCLAVLGLAVGVASANSPPTAEKEYPTSDTLTGAPGDSAEFKIYCSDPDTGDDLRSHWRLYEDGTLVDQRDDDTDLWGNEGDDAETLSFPNKATYVVDVWCDDENGGDSNTLTWEVVTGNQAPTITRESPGRTTLTLDGGSDCRYPLRLPGPGNPLTLILRFLR